MWWGFIIGLAIIAVIETIEEWRLNRGAQRDLVEMQKHSASGHKWDVTRGNWVRGA
jgi:hypothetical protein